MNRTVAVAMLAMILCSVQAVAVEKQALMMREDYGAAPFQDCTLQYYYYIPCPTYSWFWAFSDWDSGSVVGQFFIVGDNSTGGHLPCNPENCHTIIGASLLDFAGYGTVYPGLFTVEFDVYCCDEFGIPVGPSLWNSGAYETHAGWNDIAVSPGLFVTDCSISQDPPSSPRFLFTAHHVGTQGIYPQWGFDNISAPVLDGCEMHVLGCMTALYPRPRNSHYGTIHSGFYGVGFEYTPPLLFLDGADTTVDGTVYGFLEFAWKIMIDCLGPGTEPTTWGAVKALYR